MTWRSIKYNKINNKEVIKFNFVTKKHKMKNVCKK